MAGLYRILKVLRTAPKAVKAASRSTANASAEKARPATAAAASPAEPGAGGKSSSSDLDGIFSRLEEQEEKAEKDGGVFYTMEEFHGRTCVSNEMILVADRRNLRKTASVALCAVAPCAKGCSLEADVFAPYLLLLNTCLVVFRVSWACTAVLVSNYNSRRRVLSRVLDYPSATVADSGVGNIYTRYTMVFHSYFVRSGTSQRDPSPESPLPSLPISLVHCRR